MSAKDTVIAAWRPRRNDKQVNSKKAEFIEQMAIINRGITEPLLFY